MAEIIQRTLLEYEKSTFELLLVKNENGLMHIEMVQDIHPNNRIQVRQSIKINPSLVSDIIKILGIYKLDVPENQLRPKEKLSPENKQKIQNEYLKGVAIKDLALLHRCSENVIEHALRSNGIEIVSQEVPKYYRRRRRFRPKK